MFFDIVTEPIDVAALREKLADPASGGYASFEGWVRNRNEGEDVVRLEYEVYAPLARTEGERVLAEAAERFGVARIGAVHRSGLLEIGDCAVWVGVASSHRDAAFSACRYIIDELKSRLPIWKKEHYVDGQSGWINCVTGQPTEPE